MKRQDIHRPSAINPADYIYVAIEFTNVQSLGDALFLQMERELIRNHMAKTGGTWSHHEHGGNCHVCGAHCIYTVLFYHQKTNSYIRTGGDCAQKMEMGFDEKHLDAFKAKVHNHLEAQAGKKKAQAILAEAGLTAAWTIFNTPDSEQANLYEERTIWDIVGKLVKYGSVSEKQTNYVRTLLGKIENRAAIQAERAAATAAAAPAPTGRVTVSGKVLALKEVENNYRGYGASETNWKLLIQADSGYKVWCSRFANLERGERVTFKITLEPSKNDAKFAFGKRPTFISRLNEAGEKVLGEQERIELERAIEASGAAILEVCLCGASAKNGVCSVPGCIASTHEVWKASQS